LKLCLSAEGFGNRLCFLESTSNAQNVPPDLAVCCLILEQSLSVRALQEMLANTVEGVDLDKWSSQGGGHRTLLYGHAILLRHSHSSMYLSCLTTSCSLTDKLAFDVGLQEDASGEACWWTIHPASKQRSEGEKVRVGDDLILVSVSSERYLHLSTASGDLQVDASFMQTLWNMNPICSSSEEGFVTGGHVMRLFHGHMDECLTVSSSDQGEEQRRVVNYEGGSVCTHARSLWRLEPLRISWSGSHMRWGQSFRIRHVTTGRYLALTEDKGLIVVDAEKAKTKASAFCFRVSKEKLDVAPKRDIEGMGPPEIKYGESMCFVQHVDSGLWLTYAAADAKALRLGLLKRKAILHQEGHMDDALSLTRCQHEESQAARMIYSTTGLYSQFIKWVGSGGGGHGQGLTLNSLQGMISLVLNCIDRLNVYSTAAHFAEYAGEEAAESWKEIVNLLYELLASLIRGNRSNCALFSNNLDWLVSKLDRLEASSGTIWLSCLTGVRWVIPLWLDSAGRNAGVLDVLCSLCVCNGVAVRSNQNLITENLLPGRDLLLQSKLINYVTSMRPNIFLGTHEGSTQYRKWYFELIVDYVEPFVTAQATHMRVGWGMTEGYSPYPGGGEGWGGNGVGDDLYSFGFDGLHLWSGRVSRSVASPGQHALAADDVVSCCLDLSVPSISFRINGFPVQGMFENFNLDGLFFPVVSFSAGIKVRFLLGGRHGDFKFLPPPGYAPCYEALLPREKMRVEPIKEYKHDYNGVRNLLGPTQSLSHTSFTPYPVDTIQIVLPPHLERIREKLAENIHELWALTRIEQGWTYGPQDIKHKRNPRLVTYSLLDERTKKTNRDSLHEAVRTLIGYGYNIEPPDQDACECLQMLPGCVGISWPVYPIHCPPSLPSLGVPCLEKGPDSGTGSPSVLSPGRVGVGWVRTPPGQGATKARTEKVRIFRAEQSYAIKSGKWYFEFEAVTTGEMRVGWARPDLRPDVELGANELAYVFNGHRGQRWHVGSEPFGRPWQPGDVVGCMIDITENCIMFTLNGEMLISDSGSELAFKEIEIGEGFIPVCSLGLSQIGRINLGQDVSSLRYFTICGLQEGFEPFAINMKRDITMWFSKSLPQFSPVPNEHPHLEVLRIDGTVDSPPCMKLMHRTFGSQNAVTELLFTRLSMPVEFHEKFKVTPGTTPLTRAFTIPEEEVKDVDLDSEFEQLKKSASRKETEEAEKEKPGPAPSATPKEPPKAENEKDSTSEKTSSLAATTWSLGAGLGGHRMRLGVGPSSHNMEVRESDYGGWSIKRSNCYMVWGGDFVSSTQQTRVSTVDLVIGCLVDLATGLMTFTANGKEVNTFFQVEPNTKLFPAVFALPTSQNVIQFELGKMKKIMPISAAMFHSERKNPEPQCPPRLIIEMLTPVTWSRMPTEFLQVDMGRISDRHGWMVECTEPLIMMALHIPEENRCIDILELSERLDLLKFHSHTLNLYCAVCALGNNRVAHALCSHVDESQLLYTIENNHLPGPLRSGYYDLLISIHLESAKRSRLTMNSEYIVPMTDATKSITLFPDETKKPGLPGVGMSTCLRPDLHFADTCFVSTTINVYQLSPFIPLDILKAKAINMLTEAVQDGGQHTRDPVGGSVEFQFVPVLKLISTLLIMGIFEDENVRHILKMIEPNVFCEPEEVAAAAAEEKGGEGGQPLEGEEEAVGGEEKEDEEEGEKSELKAVEAGEAEAKEELEEGLLQMKLPESVKLQMCNLLQYFCDRELQHRVEAIIAFSERYMDRLQTNQRSRYSLLMQAFTMSAAETARRTREFRSPPQEQVRPERAGELVLGGTRREHQRSVGGEAADGLQMGNEGASALGGGRGCRWATRGHQRSVRGEAADGQRGGISARWGERLQMGNEGASALGEGRGESVEENANVVVRLLIRRPECFGPALRGEGGNGLLAAIEEAIKISEDPARDGPTVKKDRRFSGEETHEENRVHLGNAIMSFYAALIDLLGRCAPEMHLIQAGKGEALRIRAILRSLVPLDDLVGVISLPLQIPSFGKDGNIIEPKMSASFVPDHKAPMVLFLDRVYGIENQDFLLNVLEVGFLPDMRAAASLDTAAFSTTEMALALNRYLCLAVLPLITKCSPLFAGTEHRAIMVDSMLHTIYRLSRGRSLTKAQRDVIEECLMSLCRYIRPSMLQHLLRRLVFDVPILNEFAKMSLKLLTNHYERCWKYYCLPTGWANYGISSEEELHLTRKLFWGIFESLSHKKFETELYKLAMPCLCAIAGAIPPDYVDASYSSKTEKKASVDAEGNFDPKPIETLNVIIPEKLDSFINKYAEYTHEKWGFDKIQNNWTFGESIDEEDKEIYRWPIKESLKAMIAWEWTIEKAREGEEEKSEKKKTRKISQTAQATYDPSHGYNPQPIDLSGVTLSRELQAMAEQLAENYHNTWGRKKKLELEAKGESPCLPPYQSCCPRLHVTPICQYVCACLSGAFMGFPLPAAEAVVSSGRVEKSPHEQEIKFFAKILLPLINQYFTNHCLYFLSTPAKVLGSGGHASNKEKEMITSLFCKLAALVRHRVSLFGKPALTCLCLHPPPPLGRTVMKSGPEIVKAGLRSFFESASDDIEKMVENLKLGKVSQNRTQVKGVGQNITYTTVALLPVLTSLFEHIAQHQFGDDVMLDDVQVSCYRTLCSIYSLGTTKNPYVERQRPALGECLARLAAAMPVAFLEPHVNEHNPYSVYTTKSPRERAILGLPNSVEEMCPDIPGLERLMKDISGLAESGARYTEMPHVIEVTLPMLCNYLPRWWERGPETHPSGPWSTDVTSEQLNTLLGNILKIIVNNLGIDEASWMKRLAVFAQPIVSKAKPELLRSHFIPTMEKLKKRAGKVVAEEEQLRMEAKTESEDSEMLIRDEFSVLCRDLYALYPLLIRYVDNNRANWLTEPNLDAEELFRMVGEVFIYWSKSHNFKREEQNFVVQNEINNMSFLTADSKSKMSKSGSSDQERTKKKRRGDRYSVQTSLIVATLKKMLPIGLNMCSPTDQELINLAKIRYALKDTDEEVRDFLNNNLHLQGKCENSSSMRWQMALYKEMSGKAEDSNHPEKIVKRVQEVSAVLFHLEQTEHPYKSKKAVWHKLLSKQRRRAVVACFRMTPLYNLARHRACNMFLDSYKLSWILTEEHSFEDRMIDDLSKVGKEEEEEEEEQEEKQPDPLHQLILHFSRTALTEKRWGPVTPVAAHTDPTISLPRQEKEMEKQKLLYQQSRLHNRGAAEMVLQMISACKGEPGDMVSSTLKLGISILNGGNADVQQKMLDYLKDKREVGFFQSVQALMQTCSVLDLNAFERQNKAEGLGMVTEDGTREKVMADDLFTQDLFRFLQLLCEGHNNGTSGAGTGGTTRFASFDPRDAQRLSQKYWLEEEHPLFLFSLLQGPCTGNQQSLAHSRLWDAVIGFLHVFAHMMMKLAQVKPDSSQIGLLKELLDLQKDMVVMLLSLLEGNVVNGTIARQMVDMLVESSSNVEMILKFFDMFLKLKDIVASDAFMDYVSDPRGLISKKDFQKAMDSQKQYTPSEIQFLLSCSEADENEMINYEEFANRFQEPAKDIGFNIAVLLTNLSEHMPHDHRLKTFLELSECILNYFRPYLGRIEIMGASKRIERIYFEISETNKTQWEMPQVKESKRQFIFDVVNEGGESEKMEMFINFCEDTIFEMQIAAQISEEEGEKEEEEDEEGEGAESAEAEKASAPSEASSAFGEFLEGVFNFFHMFTYRNLRRQFRKVKKMTVKEMMVGVATFFYAILLGILLFFFGIFKGFFLLLWNTLFGGGLVEEAKKITVTELLASMPDPTQDEVHGDVAPADESEAVEGDGEEAEFVEPGKEEGVSAEGDFDMKKDPSHFRATGADAPGGLGDMGDTTPVEPPTPEGTPILKRKGQGGQCSPGLSTAPPPSPPRSAENGEKAAKEEEEKEPEEEPVKQKKKVTQREKKEAVSEFGLEFWNELEVQRIKFLNYLSRNFYNLRFLALFLAFAINFILLFYKVSDSPPGEEEFEGSGFEEELDGGSGFGGDGDGGDSNGDEEDEESVVYFFLEESTGYMQPALQFLALVHTLVAFLCIIGYNCLKVPLVIFKREKELARKLEFDGLYITEKPEDDDIKGQWDRLVLNAMCVLDKYGDIYGRERIAELLGMDLASLEISAQNEKKPPPDKSLLTWITSIDIKYQIWKFGVIFTDNSFLYLAWYMVMSVLGHYNNFFFACHLLDIAMGVKTLRTILSSVTHNGKQLMMTVGLLAVVVYLYTVVAFNFFRKFYNKSEDEDEPDMKCDDMMTVRRGFSGRGVGGGGKPGLLGSSPPSSAAGLIIDAFGELRDQQEQVKEDMETKCFICGIGSDYFDTTPHVFETHTLEEHNLANYMFFLMYLINKDETEHTGQESYVWKLYQERCWDFFPAGDCFRKQYEDLLG
uniref:Ryanodine receptor 1 n=1 Tax=Sphenodon punctatus TaxID=8508 RepID=A0A8D0GF69_SPHPU